MHFVDLYYRPKTETAMSSSCSAVRSAVVASLLASAVCSSSATTTIYTNQTAFLAALAPDSYTETFTGDAGQAPSYFFGGLTAFSYSVTTDPGYNLYRNGNFISTFEYNRILRVGFGGTFPNAIGGNFFATDTFDQFVPGVAITINLIDGTSTTFTPASANEYRGFISTSFIGSLVMTAPGLLSANTIDNFTVGIAAAVPEQSTYSLMLLGIAAVLFARRGTT